MGRIIRLPELLRLTGMSRATIYRWLGKGEFPKPLQLGPNSIGWRADVVAEWLESRPSA